MKDISIMVGNVKFNYRVGLLIIKDKKVLVEVNPVIDYVVLPGGRVKTLEDSASALQREIEEEMGIKLKTSEIKLHAFFENFFEYDGIDTHELYVLYKIDVKSDDKRFKNDMINMDSEASYYKWVNEEEMKTIKLLPAELKDILYSKDFKRVVVRD